MKNKKINPVELDQSINTINDFYSEKIPANEYIRRVPDDFEYNEDSPYDRNGFFHCVGQANCSKCYAFEQKACL